MTALGVSLGDLLARGLEHDWHRFETRALSPNSAHVTLRRLTELPTPEAVHKPGVFESGNPTYTRAEFLTFTVLRTIEERPGQDLHTAFHVRGQVIYGDARAARTGRRDQTVSQKRAYAIMETSAAA